MEKYKGIFVFIYKDIFIICTNISVDIFNRDFDVGYECLILNNNNPTLSFILNQFQSGRVHRSWM